MVSVGTTPWLAWELKKPKRKLFPNHLSSIHPSILPSIHPSWVHPLAMVHSIPRKWWLVDGMSLPDWTSHAPNMWMKNDPYIHSVCGWKVIHIHSMYVDEKGSISSRNMDEKWMITWRFLHSIEFSSTQFGVEKHVNEFGWQICWC
jgi:hypothetical protein